MFVNDVWVFIFFIVPSSVSFKIPPRLILGGAELSLLTSIDA